MSAPENQRGYPDAALCTPKKTACALLAKHMSAPKNQRDHPDAALCTLKKIACALLALQVKWLMAAKLTTFAAASDG